MTGGGGYLDTKGIGQGLSKLIGNYNRAYQEAKTANEARYQQALGILNQNTGQRLADIRSDAGNEQASIFQRLARSGLGGSSVGNVEAAGVTRRMNEELNRTSDALAAQKVGLIERRQDPYPDQGSLAELVMGIGGTMGAKGLKSLTGALAGMKF
jgi:hypothetical protein